MSDILSEKFTNGLVLEMADRSRRVAADRWLVRVEAAVGFAGPDEAAAARAGFPDAGDEAWRRLLDEPLLRWVGERNFIDAREVDRVRSRLVDDFLAAARPYLAEASFPARLVAGRLREIADRLEIERRLDREDDRDDDGPADFSHLFR